jgi:hypothetical protein
MYTRATWYVCVMIGAFPIPRRDAFTVKERKVLRTLTDSIIVNTEYSIFYWCAEDINGYDLEEPEGTEIRALKFGRLVNLATMLAGHHAKHIIDWNDQILTKPPPLKRTAQIKLPVFLRPVQAGLSNVVSESE